MRELRRERGDMLVDLDRAERRESIEAYVGIELNCLGEDFRPRLKDHTGGNPLFTVNLLGMLVLYESGRCW
jgi:hypothetical protein